MDELETKALAWRQGAALAFAVLGAGACVVFFGANATGLATAIVFFCLALWLTEAVPVFVPTLAIFVLVPGLLGPLDPAFALRPVMLWAAEPVLILFFGGFVLGVAAAHHGIDHVIARWALQLAGGRGWALVAMLAGATAFLSMWMSNIAAAALMITTTGPLLRDGDRELRAALLLAVAFGANLGGMATPIGTGPNAIALATMPGGEITFIAWMAFALPITLGMLALACGLILLRHRVGGHRLPGIPAGGARQPGQHPRTVAALAGATIAAWLSEPLHGVPAPVVSLALAAVLFGGGLLPAGAIREIDWSTLIVIAGGIALGRLIEAASLLAPLSQQFADWDTHPLLLAGVLVSVSAFMSALMSNTATATMLIPIAHGLEPGGQVLPVLIAIGASFGMPFVISTPPNAMVVGAGLRQRDLMWPGLLLMITGCALVTLTGRVVLELLGYR